MTPILQVVKALITERQYQKRRWGVRTPDGTAETGTTFTEPPHSVEEWILYMEDYLDEARHVMSRTDDKQKGLDVLRKVVTLGIACMEQHGCPERDMSHGVINARDGLPTPEVVE